MASQLSKIRRLVAVLDETTLIGSKALDAAVKSISNFSSWQSVIDTIVKDCAAYDGHYEDFLKDQCGIVLDNRDTGAITGSDAGGSKIRNAESIVSESGDWAYPENETTSNINGLTVKYPRKSTLSDAEQWIVGALDTWWIAGALELVENSYGLNFNESGTSVKNIEVKFENSSSSSLLAYVQYDKKQKVSTLTITINMKKYRDIDTTDPNGYTESAPIYLDRTIAHEITHAVMAANFDFFYQLPALFTEGIAELTHGIDDQRRAYIVDLASNSAKLKSSLSTTATSGISAINYAAGYILLRYLAKQSAAERDPDVDVVYNADVDDEDESTYSATFSDDQKTLTVVGNFPDDVWLEGWSTITGADNAYENYDTVTIDARRMTSARHVLAGNYNDNVIRAGSAGSTLWGGSGGDDSLYGGDGRDVFWYNDSDGNDFIRNFTSGTAATADVIVFADKSYGTIERSMSTVKFAKDNATLTAIIGSSVDDAVQYCFDGANVYNDNISTIKIGNTAWSNTFTVDDTTDKYLGGNGDDTLKVAGGEQYNIWLNIDEKFSSIENLDASSSTGAHQLVGSFDNSVVVGGEGNSSLWGGGVNDDTLIGGSGAEMFFYLHDNGNDVINNVGANDLVNLLNINFEQLTGIELEDRTLAVKFDNEQTLKVTAAEDDVTFQLADGSRWTFNHSSQSWRT